MKTIEEPRKRIAQLWHRPGPTQAIYRPMRYLLKTRVEDGLLLYNVITSEMILLEGEEERLFDGLPAPHDAAMDELIARHFLVPEGFDESKSVQQLRALIKKLEPSKRVAGFTILPTTECNARCYYCFESDHPHCTMTDQIASDTAAYIAEMCKGEPVQIEWFGGEPLVGANRISQICAGLRAKEIKYRSTMVSNAYLFDENLIRTAKEDWHLKSVQITLDGTEKVYNETKAYVLPKENPFQRVLRNIGALLDQEIAVNIRLNVTAKNAADLGVLIEELADRFGGKNGFTCYSHEVYDGVGFDPLIYDSHSRERIDEQTSSLDAKLREKGLLGSLSRLPALRTMHCMADNDSCRLIYPDGSVGKCENMSSLHAVGDIYRDITDQEKDAWYKIVAQSPVCKECFLFPNCFDLAPCPEAGRCSQRKRDWKKDRYTSLMRDIFLKSKQDQAIVDSEPVGELECEVYKEENC